ALYRADLLDGLSIRCREFEEWLLGERERLREQALQLFLRLMERSASSGVEPAIRWALRVLALDPVHEPANRALMQFYAMQGRHAAALRQYEQLRETLARELNTRPEPETDTLARRLREGRLGAARQTGQPAAPVNHVQAVGTEIQPPPALPDKPSIAVLPFRNLGEAADQDYLSDGITEEIITALSRNRRLFVISRGSSFTYKGMAADTRLVGRELGVRYVLEGSVRRNGDQIRVAAQVVDAATGAHLGADRYDRKLLDVFALQDEIAERVITLIEPTVSDAEYQRAARKPPENLDAWQAVQRGIWHMSKNDVAENEHAQRLFQRAIELDPRFAPAYAGLAQSKLDEGWIHGIRPLAEAAAESLRLARKAVEFDRLDVRALTVLASALLQSGEREGALEAARQAITLNPHEASAHSLAGATLVFSGRHDEGLADLAMALRLNPRGWRRWASIGQSGWGHFFAGRCEAAAEAARRVIALAPTYPSGYRLLVVALTEAGRTEEARAALRTADALARPGFEAYGQVRAPWLRPDDHARIVAALRKLG
ncbi:MAG TPA: BTAD domain-containing putative transcriptional regulator, partial [Acetobacteraceae bacterium]